MDTPPVENAWCSTKTDSNTDHVGGGGHYGECLSEACPVYNDNSEFEEWKRQNTLGW